MLSNRFLTFNEILLKGSSVQCQGIPFCLFFQMGKAVENKSRVLIGHKNHPIISLRSSPLLLTSPMPNSFVLHLQRTDEFETCHPQYKYYDSKLLAPDVCLAELV